MQRQMLPRKYTTFFLYGGKKITYNFYARQDVGVEVDSVLFMGTGQIGKIPMWTAANMPAGTVVVEGLPHWESDPSGKDLVAFSHAYTRSVYETVLATFKCAAMHIIGSSQAAPSVIWFARNHSEQVKNVALLLPMGLNTIHFGADDQARFRTLRRRALVTMMQNDQSVFGDVRNAYISLCLLRIILAGIKDGSTVRQYTVGISQDMSEDMRQLATTQQRLGRNLMVYVGARDKVFPPHEVQQALEDAGIKGVALSTVPGISHASLATQKCMPLLAAVSEDIRATA